MSCTWIMRPLKCSNTCLCGCNGPKGGCFQSRDTDAGWRHTFDMFIYYLYDSCYRFCSVSRKTWEHIYFFLEFIPQMRGTSIPWARSSICSHCGCRGFWDTCACLWLISFPCYLPVFPFFTLDFIRFSYFSIMSQSLAAPTEAKSVLCTILGNTVEDTGLRLYRSTSGNILLSPNLKMLSGGVDFLLQYFMEIWPWHKQ